MRRAWLDKPKPADPIGRNASQQQPRPEVHDVRRVDPLLAGPDDLEVQAELGQRRHADAVVGLDCAIERGAADRPLPICLPDSPLR